MYPELVLSSYLFVLVGIFAFGLKQYALGSVSWVCGIVSILYWNQPSETHMIIDKVVATSGFLIYTAYGAWKIPEMALSWLIWLFMGCLYFLSDRLHSFDNPMWTPVHMLFHCMAATGQALVIVR